MAPRNNPPSQFADPQYRTTPIPGQGRGAGGQNNPGRPPSIRPSTPSTNFFLEQTNQLIDRASGQRSSAVTGAGTGRGAGGENIVRDRFLAEVDAAMNGGGGGGGGRGGGGFNGRQYDLIQQMLEDQYAQQLASLQQRYDLSQTAINDALGGNLGSLGDIRERFNTEAQRMRQAQAEMLTGALGRVAQEEAALQADLAAQGGATIGSVGAAGADARGLLETQASSQNLLGERLAELQAAAFADREAAAQAVATGGRQQLDLQRLALQDQIQQERIRALAENEIARSQAQAAAAARSRGGGGGGGGNSARDQMLGAMAERMNDAQLASYFNMDPGQVSVLRSNGLLDDVLKAGNFGVGDAAPDYETDARDLLELERLGLLNGQTAEQQAMAGGSAQTALAAARIREAARQQQGNRTTERSVRFDSPIVNWLRDLF